MIVTKSFYISTSKGTDLVNIGHDVRGLVREAKVENGWVTVACRHPGASVATLANDAKTLAEVREGLTNPFPLRLLLPAILTVPVEQGKIGCEPWQELFLIDFDPSGRRREVTVQIFSETEVSKGRCS